MHHQYYADPHYSHNGTEVVYSNTLYMRTYVLNQTVIALGSKNYFK